MFNGVNGYEIGEGQDKHTVLLDKEMCTCRACELTGIPCTHAICALYHSKMDPMSIINMWYHKSKYLATYDTSIQLVPGPRFYKLDQFQPIEPPPLAKLAGRPRKQRVRASNEPSNHGHSDGKLSRKGSTQLCGLCHKERHNRKTCNNRGNQV